MGTFLTIGGVPLLSVLTPESSCYAILWAIPEKTNRGIGDMKFLGGEGGGGNKEIVTKKKGDQIMWNFQRI